MAKKKRKKTNSVARRVSRNLGLAALLFGGILAFAGNWFVHHPRTWLSERDANWPKFLTTALYAFGNPFADLTDGLGLTGDDAIYEYDQEAPFGAITFAGAPVRISAKAPSDIRILDRGEFLVGWSDTLRHPVWCAYHVTRDKKFDDGKRPSFLIDKETPLAPHPGDYTNSGFDRGHMVPNHAIISRFGEEARRRTFLMSNISPQSPALNRGVWRDVEHRIADLWTARYGEIWVVVGTVSSPRRETFSNGIEIPQAFYQIIIAQEGLDVRALAVLIPQTVSWDAWAARHLVSIDELEELTGLDFNPALPAFIQDPLEAELPSRLWPVRFHDIFDQILLRFK